MGRIQHWSTWCQVRVGSCGYVLSYQAPKAAAFRGPRVSNAYPLLKAPRACLPGGPGLAPGRGGSRDEHTGGKILPACTYLRVEK
jgi:hypothetical protein